MGSRSGAQGSAQRLLEGAGDLESSEVLFLYFNRGLVSHREQGDHHSPVQSSSPALVVCPTSLPTEPRPLISSNKRDLCS